MHDFGCGVPPLLTIGFATAEAVGRQGGRDDGPGASEQHEVQGVGHGGGQLIATLHPNEFARGSPMSDPG